MTEIEVIKQLKTQRTFTYGSDAKVLGMAINALEKQIQKKPIAHQCTTCGSAALPFEGNYCSKCGQKLDWSEEE